MGRIHDQPRDREQAQVEVEAKLLEAKPDRQSEEEEHGASVAQEEAVPEPCNNIEDFIKIEMDEPCSASEPIEGEFLAVEEEEEEGEQLEEDVKEEQCGLFLEADNDGPEEGGIYRIGEN